MPYNILQLVERFLKESGMPPSVFGRAAARDPRLVSDLRSGREAGKKIRQRIITYMELWRAQKAAGQIGPDADRRTREGRLRAAGAEAVDRAVQERVRHSASPPCNLLHGEAPARPKSGGVPQPMCRQKLRSEHVRALPAPSERSGLSAAAAAAAPASRMSSAIWVQRGGTA